MINSVWAIVLSIILGVASNLLTPHIKFFFENQSASAKKRSQNKKKVFENTVKYIIENPDEEIILRIRYLQRGFASLLGITIGFLFMVTNNGFLIIMGFIFSILGYYGNSKAEKFGKILAEVTKQKNLGRPEVDLS